jgi:hypothetical protein
MSAFGASPFGAANEGATMGEWEQTGLAADAGRDQAVAAELAALRARLREVEATLGLPARPGYPAPPSLGALLRRVAVLERSAGIIPGLDLLPGCAPVGPLAEARRPSSPRSRRQVWLERGQIALAAALLVALLAWLVHPTGSGYSGSSAEPTALAPTARTTALAVPAPVATLPSSQATPGLCDRAAGGSCAQGSPGGGVCIYASELGIPGEGCGTPIPLTPPAYERPGTIPGDPPQP